MKLSIALLMAHLWALPHQQFFDEEVACQQLENYCQRLPEHIQLIGDETPLFWPEEVQEEEPTPPIDVSDYQD